MTSTAANPTISFASSLVVRVAVDGPLIADYEKASGTTVAADYEPTTVLVKRIAAGEKPDVMIATQKTMDELAAAGDVVKDSVVPLVRSGIGLGVAQGAPRPDVSTKDSVVEALLSARSVAYSKGGQSGIYFQKLLDRLGISEQVLSRATAIDKGFTGFAVTDGRADLAVQQVSELSFVEGIDVAGALPEELQHYSEFAVGVGSGAADKPVAHDFVRYLTGETARAAYTDHGLQNL